MSDCIAQTVTDAVVGTVLGVAVFPGLILSLGAPFLKGDKKVFFSMKVDWLSVLIHAVVYFLVFFIYKYLTARYWTQCL